MRERDGHAADWGIDEARLRIAEAARTGAEVLDLGGLGLIEIPKELYDPATRADLTQVKTLYLGQPKRLIETQYWERSDEDEKLSNALRTLPPALFTSLPQLNSLHLDQNRIKSLPAEIAGLTALTSLNLDRNRITSLPVEFARLTALKSLNLRGNTIGAEGAQRLAPLTALTSLDLGGNAIGPAGIWALAGLAALTSLDLWGNAIGDEGARALAGLTALMSLELGHNTIGEEGARALSGLSVLQSLSLEYNDIRAEGAQALARLTALTSINLRRNGIGDKGARTLAGLTSLTSLNLGHNAIGAEGAQALAGLALTSLNLGHNDIGAEGTKALAELTALTSLDLTHNRIEAEGAQALAELTALTSLDLGENDIGPQGARALAGLTELTSLDLWGNDIGAEGAQALAGLTALTWLDLGGNAIGSEGAKALAQLTALTFLGLWDNSIGPEGAAALAGLTALLTLDLEKNDVGNLSFALNLTRLETLNCSGSQLERDFRELWRMPSLKQVVLYETIIPGVPPEILSPDSSTSCLEHLRAHFADLDGGASDVADVKLMVLGNGRVGKTQICRRLKAEAYDGRVKSTHGVQISSAPLRCEDTATLRIWDFGGQDIYHGTHTLFLKSRAIFAVVWIPESEAEQFHEHGGFTFRNQPLGYWLAYVRTFGGERSPVLVIQTQCDEPEQECLHPPAHYDALKPFPFRKLLHYSAKTDRGRGALDDALADAARWLRRDRGADQIGTGRAEVRAKLEQLYESGTQLIDQGEFLAVCDEVREEGHVISSESLLLDYLHNIGTVFYRRGLFGDAIILDQAWALDAVYAVFDRESKAFRNLVRFGGRFRRCDLADWVWKDFSVDEQDLFLTFMQQCGVCFVIRPGDPEKGIEAEYIVPDLLPDRDDSETVAQLLQKWEGDPDAEAVLIYELLPPGLMRSLISNVGEGAGIAAQYWRDGFLFYDRKTGAKAVVQQRRTEGWAGEIRVQTKGRQAWMLLPRVMALIDECHDVHGARAGSRWTSTQSQPLHRKSDKQGPPNLDISSEPRSTPRNYVSYAWGDATMLGKERVAVVDNLCSTAAARGIKILRDVASMRNGDRITDFMKDIGKGDRIFIVLSDKYFRSAYCMFELYEVWRNCKLDEGEFREHTRHYALASAGLGSSSLTGQLIDYWRGENQKIKERFADDPDKVSRKELDQFAMMRAFIPHIANIIALLEDVLRPSTPGEFVEYALEGVRPQAVE